jgi:hypothetical protein
MSDSSLDSGATLPREESSCLQGLPEDIVLSEGRNSPRSVRLSSRSDKLEKQVSQTNPSYRTRRVPHSTSRISPQKIKQDGINNIKKDNMSILVIVVSQMTDFKSWLDGAEVDFINSATGLTYTVRFRGRCSDQ